MRLWFAGLISIFSLCFFNEPANAIVRGKPVPALAMYGEPKYGPDFTHFDYANPDAPKGGTFTKANENYLTFDTFNPYTVKGAVAHGAELLLYETLMTPSQDEPASVYGLIAQTVEVAPDNSWVQFVLRPEARFNDGSPISAADVVFSYETVIAKAYPGYKTMYADVDKTVVIDDRTVRFLFKKTASRGLSFVIAETLPVLCKAFWKDRDFAATILDIPVTSGPYALESFQNNKYLLYRRREDYWGKDLPVNRGLYNFDHVRYEYFRDDDVLYEGFKSGTFDFLRVYSARRWAKAFDFPAFNDGRVARLEIKPILPVGVQPLILNLRRPLFQDRRVRQAINYAYDFESLNANLFYHLYVRLSSYWQGSPLEATGLPTAAELKLLEPFRDRVPPEVFTSPFVQPTTSGEGDARENLLKARDLLKDAGWDVRDGRLVNRTTGEPFVFEILDLQEKMVPVWLPFIRNLKRLGIEASLRMVDTSQFINRLNSFDFDATGVAIPASSLTPGNEEWNLWGSNAADQTGSNNYSGVKDPVVDALIEHIVSAETYEDLTAATRALDRVLTWNYYQILTYSNTEERFFYWTKLKRPEIAPALGLGSMGGNSTQGMGESAIALWWMDPAAATAAVESKKPAGRGLTPILGLASAGALMMLWLVLRRRRQ